MKFLYILIILTFTISLQAQDLVLTKKDRSKTISTECFIRLAGSSQEFESFSYLALVTENMKDSLLIKIRSERTKKRVDGKLVKNKVRYPNYNASKELVIAKSDIRYIKNEKQSKLGGYLGMTGIILTAGGAATLVTGLIKEDDTLKLAGIAGILVGLETFNIASKVKYKLNNGWNKKGWIME